MRVFLVRHGQSTENTADLKRMLYVNEFRALLEEAVESTLTPLGLEQAHRAGRRLRAMQPTHLYSSPFLRAHHTAQIIAAEVDLPIVVVPRLHEVIAAVPPVLRSKQPRSLRSLYIRGYLHQLWPRRMEQGETWWNVRRRAVQVWHELSSTWQPDSRVIMVGHRAFTWTLLRYLARLTPWQIVDRDLNNGGICEVVLPLNAMDYLRSTD